MESLIFNQKKCQSIVIKTMAAIAAGVGAMLCISSSVAAMMMGGSEKEDPVVPKTPVAPTEYVYDFIVNIQNEHSLRLHLADIKVDGVRATSDQVEIHVAPNRYMCGTKTDECVSDTTLGHIDAAGDMTWAAWDEEGGAVYGVGDKIFTVTSPTKVSSFEIAYQRAVYIPGWIIKENGVEAIKETANGGSGTTPSPITKEYIIPKTPVVPQTPADPCVGLVDDSLASSIPAKCLQKIFKDEGCTEQGTAYPGDDYNGWWRKDDGAGNYAKVKRDINAWATMQDAAHVKGCGRAT
jgi:hypothetical protein